MKIIVDCGTTNLRAALVDSSGQILARSARPGGVRNTAIDGHNGKFKTMLRDCLKEVLCEAGASAGDVGDCIACGMITSSAGLLEIPHLPAPVSVQDLHRGMKTACFPEIAPYPISFIPGVRNFAGAVTLENCAAMDMMRGEETQAVGLTELLKPQGESVFILPGSHNKFVRVDAQGRILGCMTSISGELLDAITHHTILAGAVGGAFAAAEDYDAGMARRGALECRRCGLGRGAFAGRILGQLGGEDSVRLRSFLLGAVLAQDVLALETFQPEGADIYIAGKPPLQQAMGDVLEVFGFAHIHPVAPEICEQMGIRGALRIAQGPEAEARSIGDSHASVRCFSE